jgi:hypothetical protein
MPIILKLEFAVWFPNNVINKCPAIIFAVSRTAKVAGRIIFLTISINTINGIRGLGVLWGTIWVNIWVEKFIHPYNMKAVHKGRAKVKFIVKWLDEVKMYGNRPKKLFIKMKENNEININVILDLAIIFFSSKYKLVEVKDSKAWRLLGRAQKLFDRIIKKINVLIQLVVRIIDDVGSKIENKFLIIFILYK